jgi:putative mRNA 3-end processing factor
MNLTFHGGCREVGGNTILVDNILLDYGVVIGDHDLKYPPKLNPTATILSHSHLDHCGALPRLKSQIFMTDVSLDLTKMLVEDSLKIAKKERKPTPFSDRDIKNFVKNTTTKPYDQQFRIGKYKCTFYDAGHIPGSAGILLEGKKRIFYTGDINTNATHLLNKCSLPRDIDILITESTYSNRNHKPRKKEELKLIKVVKESITSNHPVLIPVFAVGRSQEVLLLLENFSKKVVLDGMAKLATEITTYYSNYLKNPEKLQDILNSIEWIKDDNDRKRAVKQSKIIVATAGMLSGGPAMYYLRAIKDNPDAKILFVGFLVDDSPGKHLLETNKFYKHGEDSYPVKGQVTQLDLSSHAGKDGLIEIIKTTNPEKIFCVHGDDTPKFAREISKKFGIEAYAPKQGEKFEV